MKNYEILHFFFFFGVLLYSGLMIIKTNLEHRLVECEFYIILYIGMYISTFLLSKYLKSFEMSLHADEIQVMF